MMRQINFLVDGTQVTVPWTVDEDCVLIATGGTVGGVFSQDPQMTYADYNNPASNEVHDKFQVTPFTTGLNFNFQKGQQIFFAPAQGSGSGVLFLVAGPMVS